MLLRSKHHGLARFDDPAFLARNRFKVRPQHRSMIEGDVRDGCDAGRHNVRSIQPAAQPDLDDPNIDLLLSEHEQRHRRRQFICRHAADLRQARFDSLCGIERALQPVCK